MARSPAHQRLRRGAQPADRGGGAHGAADTADHRLRVGRGRHPRPAGRLVLRRVVDRRGRAARLGVHRARSTKRAAPSRRSSRAIQMDEIEESAYDYTKSIDDDERVIVGVNKFTMDDEPEPTVFPIDPTLEPSQIERLKRLQGQSRHRCGRVGAGCGEGRPRGHRRQPALQHQGRVASRLHTRRDQRHLARRVRRVHARDRPEFRRRRPSGGPRQHHSRRSTGRSKRSAWTRENSSGPPRRWCERPNVVRQSRPIGERSVRDTVARQLSAAVGGDRTVESRRRSPTGGDAVARDLRDVRSPIDRRRHGSAAASLARLHPAGWRLGRPVRSPPAADATRRSRVLR